jgi:superfamily I DNA/RNA helicase
LWAVYANRSLQKLIVDTIEEAWKTEGNGQSFPWGRVELCHIKDLLNHLRPGIGLRRMGHKEFDYDQAALEYLDRRPADEVAPVCHAMFIDEAQDMGPNTLKLLSALVKQTDKDDPNSRSVNIFYDNAQNVYRRSTPKWSELGLDMRGRSSVMKESFRSTRPITEFALNVLYRLQPPESDTDHKELVERGLIEKTQRNGKDWWNVRFNQVDGPQPIFRRFTDLDQEFDSIGEQIVSWIKKEGVKPSDICVIYNNQRVAWRMKQHVAPKLGSIGVRLVVETGQSFSRDPRSVTITTSQSFKGYDAEIVVIPGVDQFVAKETGILANNLYVAMTRARSILAIYGWRRNQPSHEAQIISVLHECLELLVDRAEVDKEISDIDEFEDIVERIGQNHRSWLENLWKKYWIEQEPILAGNGEIIAEPIFWFQIDQRTVACFGNNSPGKSTQFRLDDAGIEIILAGDEIS